jgi:hypothetical protein
VRERERERERENEYVYGCQKIKKKSHSFLFVA